MRPNEQALLTALNNADNMEQYFDNADSQMAQSSGVGVGLGVQKSVVGYKAQIDIYARIAYTLIAGNTEVVPSSMPAASQTGLPVFIFGNSDYYSGFAAGFKQNPQAPVWSFVGIYTVGVDNLSSAVYTTSVLQYCKKGDLLIQFQYSTTHYGFVIISCGQVAYNTLLTSLSSDRFVISQLRYTVTDPNKVSQFNQNLNMISQSLFGKISTDFVSPVSFRDPSNQQVNIIDIPIKKGIDKNTIIATYANYDVGAFTFSMFLNEIKKLQA